ncbi:hypothetical protein IFM89_027907, partial [Coptis chinensis]
AFELIQDERRAGACLWITKPLERHGVLAYTKCKKPSTELNDQMQENSGHYFGGSDQELSSRLPFDAGFEAVGLIAALGDSVTDLKVGIPAAIMTFGSYSEFMMEEDKSTSCATIAALLQVSMVRLLLWLFVHMYQELAFSLRRIYHYDESAQTKFQKEKPWTNDPHYFKRVKISALALLKMVVHARSGGNIEIMGLMQGKTDGEAIIVMDAFALPVEGTETRVNAQVDAYEYMVDYSQTNKQAGRLENVVGWYHSHLGYGCWLSGIDVSISDA